MQQSEMQITNLEALFGDMEEQLTVISEPTGTGGFEGPAMTTLPCATTATRISVATKC
ncbi:hypothetical protein [Streptomyces sp. HB132]|uniref:hypothetical protein n=1 Tax=Streptomyces sp. HB132 TaxID=767388 RepID=UPI001961E303|nr:hypothetical protein [Streptomyces sp. HB132]MBM7442694.1 hypothetical protein [Streptomyces sp. HB132]